MTTQAVSPALAVAALIGTLGMAKSAQFASVVYRCQLPENGGTGEKARHTLLLNSDLSALYQKDVETLEAVLADTLSFEEFVATITDPKVAGLEKDARVKLVTKAANEILASLKESLAVGIGHNSAYVHSPENADTFTHIDGVKGMKVHKETGVVYLTAVSIKKEVLEAGVYKPVNSRPLTVAKDAIRKNLRSGKIRTMQIKRVFRCAVAGEVLEIDGDAGDN